MGFMKPLHEFENVFRAPFVQVSGRFIGQEQSGSVHKRSGDRHALLFAARQFTRPLRAATRKPDLVQPIFRGRQSFAKGFPLNQQGHRHILGGCEIGQKVMPLPHKTDSAIAILREFSLRQRMQRTPGEVYCTAGRGVQRAQQMQKSALARTGRPDNRYHFPSCDRKIDSVYWYDFGWAGIKCFVQSFGAQDFTRV
jgi:hypothetical protein